MPRKRIIILTSLLIGILLVSATAFAWNRRLAAHRQQRESHFIAIHLLAAEAIMENADGPDDFDGLMIPWGGRTSSLAAPFPEGLVFKRRGNEFTLEEPKARRVSLFRTDRLLGTDRMWPRWESSGELAKKFTRQQVPPSGYE